MNFSCGCTGRATECPVHGLPALPPDPERAARLKCPICLAYGLGACDIPQFREMYAELNGGPPYQPFWDKSNGEERSLEVTAELKAGKVEILAIKERGPREVAVESALAFCNALDPLIDKGKFAKVTKTAKLYHAVCAWLADTNQEKEVGRG